MHQIQHRLLAAAAAVAIVSALSACTRLPGSTFTDDSVVSDDIAAVRLSNGDGNITLNGKEDATEVTIHRLVEHRGDRPEGESHFVEDGVLVLSGCGSNCSVSYTVDLPGGLAVSGETRNGSVTLAAVGDVDVNTRDGSVLVDGATGTVNVRTGNGRIHGRGLVGARVEAQTSNGAVELTLGEPQDVRVETNSGKIDLTVPEHSYQVRTRTSNGKQNVNIAADPRGAFLLELTTGNGHITINPG